MVYYTVWKKICLEALIALAKKKRNKKKTEKKTNQKVRVRRIQASAFSEYDPSTNVKTAAANNRMDGNLCS